MDMALKNRTESNIALHIVIYAPIVTFRTTLRMSAENQNRKYKATLQQPNLKHCVQSNILTITFTILCVSHGKSTHLHHNRQSKLRFRSFDQTPMTLELITPCAAQPVLQKLRSLQTPAVNHVLLVPHLLQ
ncbi:hypothetical protein RRG08_054348 [Elysia crispata]|uniref:Uncharacterized protein n=1 Tax=Elysia crispata TaxID=231223 RepID=A0AAE1B5B5_9GAST|nr:hypothetical protein RRG08_054348 [Elysia crispata]